MKAAKLALSSMSLLVVLACGGDDAAAGDGSTSASTGTEATTGASSGTDGDASSSSGGDETTGGPTECTFIDTFDAAHCPKAPPCRLYVDGSVATSGDGTSWATALRTVQEGIDLVHCGVLAGGCEQGQVWVKEGTYYVYEGCEWDAVRLRQGVAVYGGFAGDETELAARDFVAHETVLDGRDALDSPTTVYHVVHGADEAMLDGFTVQFGAANALDEGSDQFGGGLLNLARAPTIANCTFRDNYATQHGGAIASVGGQPTITGCVFEDNTAIGHGSGVYVIEGTPVISDSEFRLNASGMLGDPAGGGAFTCDGCTDALVSRSHFEANAAFRGGGVYGLGSTLTISECTFVGNYAGRAGGGAQLQFGDYVVERSAFSSNEAFVFGGALSVGGSDGSFELVNVLAAYNEAPTGSSLEGAESGPVTIRFSTIAHNLASEGTAILGPPDLTIDSSIVWNPDGLGELSSVGQTALSVVYSDIRGGAEGTMNLDVDPMFVGRDAGDFGLVPGSPCIDAGNPVDAPATDAAGNPRDAMPDIGALEAP